MSIRTTRIPQRPFPSQLRNLKHQPSSTKHQTPNMPSSSLHPSSPTKQATHHSLIDIMLGEEKPSSLLPWSSPTKHTPHNRTDMAIRGEKTEMEIKLERDGNINALQRYRYLTWRKNAIHPEVSYALLDTEQSLREIVQEEISIKEGNATPGVDAQERLRILNTKYWLQSQRWWFCRSDLEDIQLRAFKLWRSHPQWYMHRALVEECAGRQGCCARGCGCCLNRKMLPSRSLGVGHCTLECACCRRARGFEVSPTDKKLLKEQFKNAVQERGYRITRYRQVSIFGLVGDSREDPFDMIDAPPSYDQIENKGKGMEALLDWVQANVWGPDSPRLKGCVGLDPRSPGDVE